MSPEMFYLKEEENAHSQRNETASVSLNPHDIAGRKMRFCLDDTFSFRGNVTEVAVSNTMLHLFI